VPKTNFNSTAVAVHALHQEMPSIMHTLFDACTPRRDVLEGTLTESMFAAKLSDVVNGVAADVYKIPADFFASTYPTEGMRSLIDESCGRLTGQGRGASAIRLDTSFGGGKTHQLIGLYHIAHHGRSIPGIERFADPSVLPTAPVRVAAVVGSDLDPVNGIYHEQEGIRTYTLWGEIAYRLGTYDLIAQSDQQRVAPGTQWLSEMIGDQPTLIIIDEIATYLARLVGRSQAEQGQLTAFLFSLLELGTIRPQFSLVYTLATSNDALGYLTDDLRRVFEQRQVELSSVRLGRKRSSRPPWTRKSRGSSPTASSRLSIGRPHTRSPWRTPTSIDATSTGASLCPRWPGAETIGRRWSGPIRCTPRR